MSGFDARWLGLREAEDLRARNRAVLGQVRRHFEQRQSLRIVDLGCGTGANLRALAPQLPEAQHWRLLDDDPALLAVARAALDEGAADRGAAGSLRLEKFDREIEVAFERADLATSIADVLAGPAELVTAAAFFDLVSPAWIERFCGALAARALPLHAVLTYDGAESWSPPHQADAAVLAAFHVHQGRDKGFGRAAGPAAAMLLEAGLRKQGYEIVRGESPWRLGADDRALIAALADGTAAAVAETGLVAQPLCDSWREARVAARACVIGHVDLFAWPGG